MKIFYLILLFILLSYNLEARENNPIIIKGGRVYFEMTSGAQKPVPGVSDKWSYRIGAGGDVIVGGVFISGRYSIAGIRHTGGVDFPQSLVSYLRFGTGWMFAGHCGRFYVTPIISAGHTSDRIMPESGITNLQFDGWGFTPGIEMRYIVYNSYDASSPGRSSAFWSTHYLKFESHRILSDRSYTMAALSYNMVFDGFQLTLIAEYNYLEQGARGWLAGVELAFSWLKYKGQ